MKIAVIGTGYVGLVAGVAFADAGHYVTCVDKDEEKIRLLKDNIIPIYEPGLEDLMKTAKNRLTLTTDLKSAVQNNQVIFVAVGTPEKSDGSADMGPTLEVCEAVAQHAKEKKFLVLKSTVPIGTAAWLADHLKNLTSVSIEIISNPEFLKEGAAIEDFLRPDRIVIGCRSHEAQNLMQELYEPFVKNGNPIIFMDNASAEMTKYAANAFLSVKISFINELALLADKVGADINQVRKGFTSDRRINPAFFHPGVGFGGSCFPKDVKALVHTGQKYEVPMQVVHAADEANSRQKLVLVNKVKKHFKDLKNLQFAVWGLSFKPRTDDVREAPAYYIIKSLLEQGAKVRAYDPIARETARKHFSMDFEITDSAEKAAEGADALLVVTEWNEFKNPDFTKLKSLLKQAVIFDGRNVFDPKKMREHGFSYYCIGRENIIDYKS